MANSKNKTENSGTLLHATKQIEENWWSDNNDINVIFAYIYIQNFGVFGDLLMFLSLMFQEAGFDRCKIQ